MATRKTAAKPAATTPAPAVAAPKPLSASQTKSLQRILVGKIVDTLAKYQQQVINRGWEHVGDIPVGVYIKYLADELKVTSLKVNSYRHATGGYTNIDVKFPCSDDHKLVAFAKTQGVKFKDAPKADDIIQYKAPTSFLPFVRNEYLYAPTSKHADITAAFKAIEEIELSSILSGDVEKAFRAIEATIAGL